MKEDVIKLLYSHHEPTSILRIGDINNILRSEMPIDFTTYDAKGDFFLIDDVVEQAKGDQAYG